MHLDSSKQFCLISHAFCKHSEGIRKTGTCGVTKNVPFLEFSSNMSYMHVNQAFETPQTRFPRLKTLLSQRRYRCLFKIT